MKSVAERFWAKVDKSGRCSAHVTEWVCPRCGKTVRGKASNIGGDHRHRKSLTGWCRR